MTGAGTAREERRPQLGTATRAVAVWVAGGLIAYLLVPQLATASRNWGRLASPVWAWIGVAGGAMVLTHVMGALVLTGSTLAPLSYPKTLAVQFMVSFTNRLAPSGLGGVATAGWYLRRSGADLSAALAALALISSVGFAVHLAAIGVALSWAGSAPMERLRLPVWWPLAVAAIAFLGASVIAAATPAPGGMGAAEAALITVTTGLVGPTRSVVDALPAYRLITYWFPVLPGAAAFVYLRRRTDSSTAPEGTPPTGGPSACYERDGRSEEAEPSWLHAGG